MARNFIDQVNTAAVGTNWTVFSDRPADTVRVHNNTGTSIDVRLFAGGNSVTIPTGNYRTFQGVNNANEVAVRRTDVSNTQVAVQAEVVTGVQLVSGS